MMQRLQRILKEKKGGGIFEFIIVLAIVAIIAMTTLPDLNSNISEKAGSAIDRIDTMDDALDN